MTVPAFEDAEGMRIALAQAGTIPNAVLYNNGKALTNALAASTGQYVSTPVGTIVPYAGSDLSTPAGWLFCGGQTVSQTTYASLYAVVGSTYNTGGEAAGQFRLPDLRGRVLAGKDNMGGTAASRLTAGVSGITGTTLGAAGGSEALHQHTHVQNSHVHTYGYRDKITGNPASTVVAQVQVGANNDLNFLSGDNALNPIKAATATNQNTGTGNSQNVQPTIVTNYIIKAIADTTTGSLGVSLTGAAGGALSGSYPSPTLAASIPQSPKFATNDATLTVAETAGNGFATVNLTDNNSSIASEGLQLRYDSATGISYIRSTYSLGSLYLGSGSASAAQVSVDQSGRFLTPNNPGFFAYSASNLSRGVSDQSACVWANTVYNTGSCYNTTTGRFTAPVSGYYIFCASIRVDGGASGSYMRWGIKKNNLGNGWDSQYGNQHAIFGGTHPTDYITLPVSTVIYLAANDYVWSWAFHVGSGTTIIAAESSFSGYLLG